MPAIIEKNGLMYPAPNILPLSRMEIEQKVGMFFEGLPVDEARRIENAVRIWNKRCLDDKDRPIGIRLIAEPGFIGDAVRGIHRVGLIRQLSGREPFITTNFPGLIAAADVKPEGFMLPNAYIIQRYLFGIESVIFSPLRRRVNNRAFLKDLSKIHVFHPDLDVNQLQWLQLVAFSFFDTLIEDFPLANLSFSKETMDKAVARVDDVALESKEVPVLVYPDASKVLFHRKRWDLDAYAETLARLTDNWGSGIRIILLTGVDHPEETVKLSGHLTQKKVKHQSLGMVKDLAEFAAMIAVFGKHDAVMLGTESLVASHLAPMLNNWSVVLGWNTPEFQKLYSPVEMGSTIVGSLSERPTPQLVGDALDFRIDLRLRNKALSSF